MHRLQVQSPVWEFARSTHDLSLLQHFFLRLFQHLLPSLWKKLRKLHFHNKFTKINEVRTLRCSHQLHPRIFVFWWLSWMILQSFKPCQWKGVRNTYWEKMVSFLKEKLGKNGITFDIYCLGLWTETLTEPVSALDKHRLVSLSLSNRLEVNGFFHFTSYKVLI